MKNPNAPISKLKKFFKERWSGEDHPGSTKRFQIMIFAKDFGIFVMLPLLTVFMFKSCENALSAPKKVILSGNSNRDSLALEVSKSQIIDFAKRSGSGGGIYAKKAPGTLVKVRLLNNLETYSAAPVHAQIIDSSLGRNLYGGTMVGEASPDTGVERVNIVFQYVKDPNRSSVAVPIAARALSLDGTFGVIAKKKGNVFARSALASAPHLGQSLQEKTDSKGILLRALSSGFMEEGSNDLQAQRNRLQVLTVQSNAEFYVELTDYFPGSAR